MTENYGFENCSNINPLLTHEAFEILSKKEPTHFKSKAYEQLYTSTLEYTRVFSRNQSLNFVENVKSLLSGMGLKEPEIYMIGILIPQTVDELKSIVPSVARFETEKLNLIVNQISEFLE